MQSLVAFSLLVVAALADPQVTPFGYGYTAGVYPGVYGAYPYAGGYVAGSSPFVAKSVYYPTVAVPSQDTSRGLPQPVEDTAEVKAAKANFAAEYYRTAARAAVASPVVTYPYAGAAYVSSPVVGTPVVAVESRRHKREVQTPASTTPLVYARAAPAVVAPYTAAAYPYTASYAAPYAAAPYVYGGAYYNTAAYSYPYAGAAAPVTYAY
ncbi:uncharacterized protein LOC135948198 [Cloeon dipterum]|uniref:uncharacterized protein LOC135948198 n=1 Tax=Cloeon dipterum TaxID=197152 RepID=UPI00321F9D54